MPIVPGFSRIVVRCDGCGGPQVYRLQWFRSPCLGTFPCETAPTPEPAEPASARGGRGRHTAPAE